MKQAYRVLHLANDFSNAGKEASELKKSKTAFEHLVVVNKEEFLNALVQFSPDIIICSHSLTPFNFQQALEILKQKKIDIPCILISPSVSDEGPGYLADGDTDGHI